MAEMMGSDATEVQVTDMSLTRRVESVGMSVMRVYAGGLGVAALERMTAGTVSVSVTVMEGADTMTDTTTDPDETGTGNDPHYITMRARANGRS